MGDPTALYYVTAVVVLGLFGFATYARLRLPPLGPPLAPRAREGTALDSGDAGASEVPPESVGASRGQRGDTEAASNSSHPPYSSRSELLVEDTLSTAPRVLVTAHGHTDPGKKRQTNEDALLLLPHHHVFVIADGMGRHAAGEVASSLCVNTIRDVFEADNFPPREGDPKPPLRAHRLAHAIRMANDVIAHAAAENEEYDGMGTTVVAAYFSSRLQYVQLAHVGDSRCYRYRDGTLVQLTRDHTLGEQGIPGHMAHHLSRAVGIEETVEVELSEDTPELADTYLLCSDGLSRMVPLEQIGEVLGRTDSLDKKVQALIALANEKGGNDNVTAILARIDAA